MPFLGAFSSDGANHFSFPLSLLLGSLLHPFLFGMTITRGILEGNKSSPNTRSIHRSKTRGLCDCASPFIWDRHALIAWKNRKGYNKLELLYIPYSQYYLCDISRKDEK
jgi:hypothetical protein